jgi:hypothetical protein
MASSDIELAWAAGFFDGEGSFSLHTRGDRNNARPRLIIFISQCDREVLDRFAEAVGLGNVNGPYSRGNPKWRDYYTYGVQGQKVKVVAKQLWPYLGKVKKRQFKQCVDRIVAHDA